MNVTAVAAVLGKAAKGAGSAAREVVVVAAQHGGRAAAATGPGRVVVRKVATWRDRLRRWVLLLVVSQLIVFAFSYGIAPGGPLVEPSACQTATGQSVAGQSAVVVMARAQGEALQNLAGAPPDPAVTQQWASAAADQVVVAVLALKASARGQDDPPRVTAHQSATQQAYQAEQAAAVAAEQACAPCPHDDDPTSGQAPDVQAAALRGAVVPDGAAASAVPVVCGTSTGTAAAGSPAAGGGSGGAGAWGGHANGRIPSAALCAPTTHPGHLLRCDAATALEQLAAAYRARFGRDLAITDSYRDYDAQVRVKAAKPGLAATPGRSNHGWGLALDLGGGIQTFATAEHDWMRQHAPGFGWTLPGWARTGGSKPEPWHWEYSGSLADDKAGEA